MDKDPSVSLLVATRNQLFDVDCLSAESIVFFGNNHFVAGIHLDNLVCKEDERLCFVVIVSQEVLPIWWQSTISTHSASDSLPRFDLVSALRLDGRYTSNTMSVLS